VEDDFNQRVKEAVERGSLDEVRSLTETRRPEQGLLQVLMRSDHETYKFDPQKMKAMVDLLLELGQEIEGIDVDGRTPLLAAVVEGQNVDIVSYLIKKGAQITAKVNGMELTEYSAQFNSQVMDLLYHPYLESKLAVKMRAKRALVEAIRSQNLKYNQFDTLCWNFGRLNVSKEEVLGEKVLYLHEFLSQQVKQTS
jgi:ankyrin repeat protein